jgi:hypothetical protein
MALDLIKGTLEVKVADLPAEETFVVWLVDNRPGSGKSVKPEPGDAMIRVGTLKHESGVAHSMSGVTCLFVVLMHTRAHLFRQVQFAFVHTMCTPATMKKGPFVDPSVTWRKCMGIEPTREVTRPPHRI